MRSVACVAVAALALPACRHAPATVTDGGTSDLAMTTLTDMASSSNAPLWPLAAHDSQRRSLSSLVGPTTPVTLKWSLPMLDGVPDALVDATGTIAEELFPPNGDALINPDSGMVVRSNNQLSVALGFGADGTLFVESSPTQLGALDPTTLMPRWTATVPDHPTTGFSFSSDGAAAFFMGGSQVVAVGVADGSVRWAQPFVIDFTKTPRPGIAVGTDGAVIAVDSTRCIEFDGADGHVRWSVTAAHTINYPPAVGADGAVYLFEGDPGADTFLTALDRADGSVRWNIDLQTPVRSGPPAVGPDGTILIVTPSRYAAFDINANLKWSVPMSSTATYSRPTVDAAGNSFLLIDGGQTIAAFSSTGTPLWTTTTTKRLADGIVIGAGGALYINGYSDQTLYGYAP